jgi:hypothetical protein
VQRYSKRAIKLKPSTPRAGTQAPPNPLLCLALTLITCHPVILHCPARFLLCRAALQQARHQARAIHSTCWHTGPSKPTIGPRAHLANMSSRCAALSARLLFAVQRYSKRAIKLEPSTPRAGTQGPPTLLTDPLVVVLRCPAGCLLCRAALQQARHQTRTVNAACWHAGSTHIAH